MSEKGSTFQKGGGGTNFEQYVQAAFLVTLITKGNAPCIPSNEVIEMNLQATNAGWQTDDLLVIAKSRLGTHQLLLQSKHNLTFSDNDTFNEVISGFWKDFKNPKFDKEKDRLIIVKNRLNNIEKNHIKGVLTFAKTHTSETDFLSEVLRVAEKKERLDTFKAALKVANNNTDVSDKSTWEFLKCVDVLGYDFLNPGSVDETYTLNLIKLSKSDDITASETEIWNAALAQITKLNPAGGSITLDSIKNEDVYALFNAQKLNPTFLAVDKLKRDGEAILNPLTSKIGTSGNELHIDRKAMSGLLLESVNTSNFVIVTGKPGVGKSAIVKDVLATDFGFSSIFVFRADQFNVPHLANTFSDQGIGNTLQDIFSCISLVPDKILVIDSLEKLLEGDPENAFKQLVALLKQYPDIKVIGTSRKYAVQLIMQKFGLEEKRINTVEILPLNEDELSQVAGKFPVFHTLLNNPKIKTLLQSPKYLDFALKSLIKSEEDYSAISLTEFKNKLWNILVEDITTKKSGVGGKRRKAFLNVALKRARKMSLFVEPDDGVEDEAIEALEKDEIIFRNGSEYQFSPSHDILEDWALVKYVSTQHEEHPKAKDLFNNLGTAPAIRRAFRLWVEDYLVDNSTKIVNLIKETISDSSIERYWADELLVAVFKSESCNLFFAAFEKELLKNNCSFLNRTLHIIRTACKENHANPNNGLPILLPMGPGWKEVILFLAKYISKVDDLRLLIMRFLYDWEFRLLFDFTGKDELLAVKDIAFHFINQIEKGEEFWDGDEMKQQRKNLISLIFNLAGVSKDEITAIVSRAVNEKEEEDWTVREFYKMIVEDMLIGPGTQTLCLHLPKLVIETLTKTWTLKLPEKGSEEYKRYTMYRSRLRTEDCWGIQEHHQSFFPSGVHKTPIYNILVFHPILGLEFITSFLNYSIEFYAKSDCEYKHNISQIEIELNDGTHIKQWAGWELWGAYRGASVTHYAIESLLMGLEKYILEVAAKKTEASRKELAYVFNYLIRNSNNVTTISVLTSVAIAYPTEIGEEALPIFSVKEFYSWDISRSLREHQTLAPVDNYIPYAQRDRYNSNQLLHRRKYTRGLADFIIDYQFNVRVLNVELHKIIDRLKDTSDNSDVTWRKMLTEIDIRTHELGDYDEKIGGFPIMPKYSEEISEFMQSGQEEFKEQSTTLNYSSIITKAYEERESITFEIWTECYNYYQDVNNINYLFAKTVSLSAIGLKHFYSDLSEAQQLWCFQTILNTAGIIINQTNRHDYGLNSNYNLMEKQIALCSFHLIVDKLDLKEDQDQVIYMIVCMLSAPFGDHEIQYLTNYFRNTFFKQYHQEAKKIWMGLIKYAKFKKSDLKNPFRLSDEEIVEEDKKKDKFLREVSSMENPSLEIVDLNFENYDASNLTKVLLITPYYLDELGFTNFIHLFIPLLVQDFKLEQNYSYNHGSEHRKVHHSDIFDIKLFLIELLLNSKTESSTKVIDLLLDPVYNGDFRLSRHSRNDLFEFCSNLIKYVIYQLDDTVSSSQAEQVKIFRISNFWKVWEYLRVKIKNSGQMYFTNSLLLGIEWNVEFVHWQGLEGKESFYYELMEDFGATNVKAIIEIFSTVGEKTFLPQGLAQLTELLQKHNSQQIYLTTKSSERLIQRLFYNHIAAIKRDKKLIDNLIWILDKMVELGSSSAYLFRENVITYKTN